MKPKLARKKAFVSLLLVFALVLLAACGGGSGSGGSQQAGTGSPSAGTSSGSGGSSAPAETKKETVRLRVGAGHPPEAAKWVELFRDWYIPEVNKRLESTRYQIDWFEAYGGTVVVMGEELSAIGDNTVDMGFVTVAFYPSRITIANIGYNTPFSSPDPRVIAKAAQKLFDKYPQYAQEFEENNQKVLSIISSEGYELFTKFPVNSLADLQNRKIAAVGANLHWINNVGTVPVQSNVGEAYQSLQSGVYEGWVMLPDTARGYRLHEVAPHLTKVGFGSVILSSLTINLDAWNKLPDEVKNVLAEGGAEFGGVVANAKYENTQNVIAGMEKEGLKVSQLPEADVAKWIEAVQQVPNHFVKILNDKGHPGKEIVEDYIKFQEEEGYTFTKRYVIQ